MLDFLKVNVSINHIIFSIIAMVIALTGWSFQQLYAQQNEKIIAQNDTILRNHTETMETFDKYVTNTVILQMMKNFEDRNQTQVTQYIAQRNIELKKWDQQKVINEKLLESLYRLDTTVRILIKSKGMNND